MKNFLGAVLWFFIYFGIGCTYDIAESKDIGWVVNIIIGFHGPVIYLILTAIMRRRKLLS